MLTRRDATLSPAHDRDTDTERYILALHATMAFAAALGGRAVIFPRRQQHKHGQRHQQPTEIPHRSVACRAQAKEDTAAATAAAASLATPSRRAAVFGAALMAATGGAAASAAGEPLVGDCVDCVGVVGDAGLEILNSCPEETEACVSSQNDDEAHFATPWAYPGDRPTAMRRLVAVATGGVASPSPTAFD